MSLVVKLTKGVCAVEGICVKGGSAKYILLYSFCIYSRILST